MREDHVAGRGATPDRAREDRQHYSAELARHQAADPVRDLIARLDAAAASGGPVTLDGRQPIRARAIPGGFALERRR